MLIRTPAVVCAARPHGEVGVILRAMTEDHGMVGAYVAGGRGRALRPVLIAGNTVALELNVRLAGQMPSARVELIASRAPFLAEPLPAAAIDWATALSVAVLPERHPYPALYDALTALLDAVCHAPSARGWVRALVAYEALVLRELGYGDRLERAEAEDWAAQLAQFDRIGRFLERYLLADRRGDVMGAREMVRQRLGRIGGAG